MENELENHLGEFHIKMKGENEEDDQMKETFSLLTDHSN